MAKIESGKEPKPEIKGTIYDKMKIHAIGEDCILNKRNQRFSAYKLKSGIDAYFDDLAHLYNAVKYVNTDLSTPGTTVELLYKVNMNDDSDIDAMSQTDSLLLKNRVNYMKEKLQFKKIDKYLFVTTDPFSDSFPEYPVNESKNEYLLESLDVKADRLTTKEIKKLYYQLMSIDGDMYISPTLSDREQLIQQEYSYDKKFFKIGKYYVKVLSIKDFPDEADFFHMDSVIDFFHFPFFLMTSFSVLNQTKENVNLSMLRRSARADIHKFGEVNIEAQEKYEEACELIKVLNNSKHSFTAQTLKFVVWDTDLSVLADKIELIQNRMKRANMLFYEETLYHDIEFFNSVPASTTYTKRFKKMLSFNSLSFFPLSEVKKSNPLPYSLPLRTTTGESFCYDPFDDTRANFNAMVFGSSGSGKSVIINMLILYAMWQRIEQEGGQIFILDFAGDEKSSYLKVKELFNGVYIPIGTNTCINLFCPRDDIYEKDKKGNFITEINDKGQSVRKIDTYIIEYFKACFDIMLEIKGNDADNIKRRHVIEHSILNMYEEIELPVFQDLLPYVKNLDTKHTEIRDEIYDSLEILSQSQQYRMISGKTNVDYRDNPLVIFDLHGLDGLSEEMKQLFLFIITNEVRRVTFKPGGYKFMLMDEVAQHIRNESMLKLVLEMYATARKWDASVWTITQNFIDYMEAKINIKMKNSTTTTIFLPHLDKDARELVEKSWGFSEKERMSFSKLKIVKRKYSNAMFTVKDKDQEYTAVTMVELSPIDYWLATTDDKDNEYLNAICERYQCSLIKACNIASKYGTERGAALVRGHK